MASQPIEVRLRNETDSLKTVIKEMREEWAAQRPQEGRVELANTEVRRLTSRHVNQEFQLKIAFPKSYHSQQERRYPVLVVTDAETNFGAVAYAVQRLAKDGLIPETLVVGIAYNTSYKEFYRLRSRDLTPVVDAELRMGNGAVDPTGGAPDFTAPKIKTRCVLCLLVIQ